VTGPSTDRADRGIGVALALVLFSIYAFGACRTIYVGDSGELVTAVHTLGIPHPSGYPLYVLLGKLWTILVPVGSIAFRMSLFSAACAAAACALLFVIVRRDGGSRIAGLSGAGLLAFGPSFWHEANIQRVYALNALLLVLAVDRALSWYRTRRPCDLVLAMAICGLGATNHTVMFLVGIAVALWAPIVEPRLFRMPKLVALCGGAFMAGLLVYAFLPIRSRMSPILNWGEPSTWSGFLDVVLRRNFWHRAWWESPSDLQPILLDFAKSLGPETGFAGAALALLVLFVRPDRKWLLPALVIMLNVAAVARHGSYYDIFVWHRYYIPAYAMVALLAASGLDTVRQMGLRNRAGLFLAIPIVMLVTGWAPNDRSRHRYAEDFSRLVLDSPPPGARLLTNDDNVLFVLLYLKYVERLRPDVELIAEGVDQRKPDLFFDPDNDAVFFTHFPDWRVDGLAFAPRGVVVQATREGRALPEPLSTPPLAHIDDPGIPRDFLTRALIAHYWFMQALTWEHRDWPRAENALERGLAVAPDYPLSLHNLGVIWARNGFYDEALAAFEEGHRINPRGIDVRRPEGERSARLQLPARIEETRRERARIRALERTLASEFPSSVREGSVEWHAAMAQRLASRGELAASRFHFLAAAYSGP
jgi:tetratricopeptide (TPR) repeat protein